MAEWKDQCSLHYVGARAEHSEQFSREEANLRMSTLRRDHCKAKPIQAYTISGETCELLDVRLPLPYLS